MSQSLPNQSLIEFSVRALVRVKAKAIRQTELQEPALFVEFLSRSTDGEHDQGDMPSETFSYRLLQPLPQGTNLIDWVAFCNIRAAQAKPARSTASRPLASDIYSVDSFLAWYEDKDGDVRYLVKWDGYSYAESSWVYVNFIHIAYT